MKANIKKNGQTRIVIAGGGIGGLKLATSLRHTDYQVVLIDKNNYNQFPPLIYQVASAGLEPSNIAFPFRRIFQGWKNFFYRMAEVKAIDEETKTIETTVGSIQYDYLILAAGATTNFFGNRNIEENTLPMKTVTEAMALRNTILSTLEKAETEDNPEKLQALMNFVIVGGGPSGVEIAGALADMKKYVLPRDYHDLLERLHIYLLNASDRLLQAMDPELSAKAEADLRKMNVHVRNNWIVTDYSNGVISVKNGEQIRAATVIWVSGIKANTIAGVPQEAVGHNNRLVCDRMNRVKGMTNVFCIGDQSIIEGDESYPLGHPQVAQVAMQQAENVAKNIQLCEAHQDMKPFTYNNLGTMATIGRKRAVAEIRGFKFGGFIAWLLWLVVHLRSILGIKNKLNVFLNWVWGYINYKQNLRLILRPEENKEE